MIRLMVLLLGMLTTQAGRPGSLRLEDPGRRRDPGELDEAGGYGDGDGWIAARDPLVPTRRGPVLGDPWPDRPERAGRARRRLLPRWVRWGAVLVLLGLIFRKAIAWAMLAVLAGALHLFGLNVHLPDIKLTWPWQSVAAGTTTDTEIGPWVLQKIEGISRPALGTENFNFVFTHKVSKSIGPWPCWYSGTFYAVGRASATVELNPGPGWWTPASGHYQLKVLSRPVNGATGRVVVAIVLPPPQLPQSVHDITVDNTLSHLIATDHSWTYPGFGCGALLTPQFSPAVLYGLAQNLAFSQATGNPAVTRPMISAAENEAAQIIRDNFVQPTVNALGYKLAGFTLRWSGTP
jgi:hypothetical protein